MLWFGTVPCWQCPVPFIGYCYASRYALCPFEPLYIIYVRNCTKVDVPEGGLEGHIADVRVKQHASGTRYGARLRTGSNEVVC